MSASVALKAKWNKHYLTLGAWGLSKNSDDVVKQRGIITADRNRPDLDELMHMFY